MHDFMIFRKVPQRRTKTNISRTLIDSGLTLTGVLVYMMGVKLGGRKIFRNGHVTTKSRDQNFNLQYFSSLNR